MKKLLALLLSAASLLCVGAAAAGCDDGNTIYVQTNAFFAPFEYYDNGKIVGVDVEIMNKVGEKLGKKVVFQDGDFGAIIQLVHEGRTADAGAAGITITDERKELVDFSIPYYTAVQYVIWDPTVTTDIEVSKNTNDEDVVLWSELRGKVIGVQNDTTGDIYVNLEINAEGDDYDPEYTGQLQGSGASCNPYENAQMAVEAMYGGGTDSQRPACVVVDEMPATYLTNNMKDRELMCAPLYYTESQATEEEYAICVTPGNTELLNAINEVLEEMLKNGEIDKLVSQHLGLGE